MNCKTATVRSLDNKKGSRVKVGDTVHVNGENKVVTRITRSPAMMETRLYFGHDSFAWAMNCYKVYRGGGLRATKPSNTPS